MELVAQFNRISLTCMLYVDDFNKIYNIVYLSIVIARLNLLFAHYTMDFSTSIIWPIEHSNWTRKTGNGNSIQFEFEFHGSNTVFKSLNSVRFGFGNEIQIYDFQFEFK